MKRIALILTIILVLVLFAGASALAQGSDNAQGSEPNIQRNYYSPDGNPLKVQAVESDSAIYIVVLDAPALPSYRGGIPALPATNPEARGEQRLDAKTTRSWRGRNCGCGRGTSGGCWRRRRGWRTGGSWTAGGRSCLGWRCCSRRGGSAGGPRRRCSPHVLVRNRQDGCIGWIQIIGQHIEIMKKGAGGLIMGDDRQVIASLPAGTINHFLDDCGEIRGIEPACWLLKNGPIDYSGCGWPITNQGTRISKRIGCVGIFGANRQSDGQSIQPTSIRQG